MKKFVLDSFALIAYCEGESACKIVIVVIKKICSAWKDFF